MCKMNVITIAWITFTEPESIMGYTEFEYGLWGQLRAQWTITAIPKKL